MRAIIVARLSGRPWRARRCRWIEGGGVVWAALVSGVLGTALVLACTVVLAAPTASGAAGAGSGRERLPGHQGLVPPGATLVGPAPATTALPLVVTLKPRDPAALAREVQAITDPGSPEYRHFLTPTQFAQRFGATPATIAQVTSALQQEGLTVGTPSATGLSIPVSSTVAQVQSAFATPISKYRLSSGKTGYDNTAAPEVPSTVAPQIQGVLGLDTLSPPLPSTSVPEANPAAARPEGGAAPATLAPGQPSPQTGSCASSISSVQGTYGALDAPQLAQAYSFGSLYTSGDYGAGATIALVEMAGAGYSQSDINTYANCYGITLANGADHPDERRERRRRRRVGHRGGRARHRDRAVSWRPRRTSRSTREARRAASTTSSARS